MKKNGLFSVLQLIVQQQQQQCDKYFAPTYMDGSLHNILENLCAKHSFFYTYFVMIWQYISLSSPCSIELKQSKNHAALQFFMEKKIIMSNKLEGEILSLEIDTQSYMYVFFRNFQEYIVGEVSWHIYKLLRVWRHIDCLMQYLVFVVVYF